MKEFFCPFCNEKLSSLDGTLIRLKGTMSCEMFECTVDFYLAGTLGKYDAFVDDFVKIKKGVKVNFHCPNPNCSKSFTAHYNDDLSEIKMMDDDNKEHLIVFNRIYGKQSTFVMDPRSKQVEHSYGVDKEDYWEELSRTRNFFGA